MCTIIIAYLYTNIENMCTIILAYMCIVIIAYISIVMIIH